MTNERTQSAIRWPTQQAVVVFTGLTLQPRWLAYLKLRNCRYADFCIRKVTSDKKRYHPVLDRSGDGVLFSIDFFVCLFVCLFASLFLC